MASSSSCVKLCEDQFQCSICLDVFTDPVSTPCGHNFCRACLDKCWDNTRTCQCPYCKEKFPKRPELCVNTFISGLVLQFKESLQITSNDATKKPTAKHTNVPCDFCTDPKEESLKSCLDCGMSFCEVHLEHHKTVAKLKKHKLINPVKNLEDYICQKHERAIELFCRDDQMCVCLLCTETDHKSHNTVLIEEEGGQRKALMKKTQAWIQKMIQDRMKKIEDIKRSLDRKDKIADKQKVDSAEVFRALILSIESMQAKLFEEIEEKQKAAALQAEGFIKVLEQDIVELKRRVTELEKLSHTEDSLHLVQNYPSTTLSTIPHTKDWTSFHIQTEESKDNVRRALIQLQGLVNKELEKTPKIIASLDTQKAEIQQLFKTHLVEGDTWYLVDSSWFKKWKTFVGFDSWNINHMGDDDFYPGPVDNSGLLQDSDSFTIKEHLIDELDYILLPTEGWIKLIDWYGLTEGQKPVSRKVVTFGMFVKHYKVEVYLTELNLCECSDMDNIISKYYSKADTISSIEKDMRSLFNIPDEKKTRLWCKYMSNTFEKLDNPKSTILDAGLFSGQVLVIEQKKKDGTWSGIVEAKPSPGHLHSL